MTDKQDSTDPEKPSSDPSTSADEKGEADASSPRYRTDNTLFPRHMAAIVDLLICYLLSAIAGKLASIETSLLQVLFAFATALLYYFLLEGLTRRTLGKFIMGLMIVRADGRPAGFREALIRTAWRLLEVNPILIGALPAALRIVFSRQHQRWGDEFAGTLVVPADVHVGKKRVIFRTFTSK